MHLIEGNSFGEVYKQAIITILGKGQEVSPRGQKTYELAPATIVINDARKFLTMPKLRKGNYAFQLAELLWIIRGSNSLKEISHYNKVWEYFEDEDFPGILNGAYGDRLRNWSGIDQFAEVYKKLKQDPYSRQAVMIIYDPERDNLIHKNGKYSKDIPCTNYFAFQIRDGKLNMYTVMRSNDLHKGTLYDIPNFITIQHILAGWLGVEVGKYEHVAISLHIYESDVENFIEIYNNYEDIVDYKNNCYGDPRLSLEEFNDVMETITVLEYTSRTTEDLEQFKADVPKYKQLIETINNSWWRSVAALIVLYNYRKLKASEDEFKTFLSYIDNEYRNYAGDLKKIGGK